ncbi:MAG: efflux RND transporter periplasmic adaptor subunit [Xanthomonadales bacterium]|nr:efflux RND transporter periplasmic adaptor subunit [Xanthomonadales bacterium]
MKPHWIWTTFLLTALLGCSAGQEEAHDHAAGADHEPHADAGDEHADDEVARGPHGGRLLQAGGLTLELAIHEAGVPPRYRAWITRAGTPVAADQVDLQVRLTRLGSVEESHRFEPVSDYLQSLALVTEPHSFDVAISLAVGQERANWSYPSYEGRTTIAADVAADAGIRVAPAGPGVIADVHEVQGLLTPIEARHARVGARFPGPIRSVTVAVGDQVKQGQTLATVDSNVSLSPYAVTAPFDGVVLERRAGIGEIAGSEPLFELADLSTLWVDLHLFGADAGHIRAGLPVQITRLSDGVTQETELQRVLPVMATASQSTVARATLDNGDGQWRPGAAVRARVTVAEEAVALAVPLSALQRFRDWDVVFIRVGEDYEVRPLELGRRDGEAVEVLDGLRPGDQVVVEQSYLIKADIEKSGASHDH